MNYVIVRSTRSLVDTDQADTVNAVYGPYDEQGATRAYRGLVAAGLGSGASNLHVRGLIQTDEDAIATAVIEHVTRERLPLDVDVASRTGKDHPARFGFSYASQQRAVGSV